MEAIELWQQSINAPDVAKADLKDADLRHHCYELQIAASHFGWNIWIENEEGLEAVAKRAEYILNRGPLSLD